MNIHDMLETAITIALEAGALLRQGFRQHKQIETKSTSRDWVTQYDKAAEDLILRRLKTHFPDHNIIGEEGGGQQTASPYGWIVDPLDGTTNFAHGLPVFAVSIALYRDNLPLIGVVYDVERDECFQASAGQGAYVVSPLGRRRLQVSEADNLSHSLLGTGFPYDRSQINNSRETAVFLQHCQDIRRAGSAALDLAYVAAGRLDGYWEYNLQNWDAAAGIVLILEAGGYLSLISGEPFVMAPQVSVIASNGRIHTAMQTLLHSLKTDPTHG